MRLQKWVGALAAVTLLLSGAGPVMAGVINFDVDANGNTINAPSLFANTTALTNLYAPLGVHFSGPGGNDGGAIINQAGNFGENARSQPNFLAFNTFARLSNGGTPRGPETITFDASQSAVSLFASDAGGSDTFRLDAFNAVGTLVASDTETAGAGLYALLSVSSPDIDKVIVTETGGVGVFVLDDLSFTPAGPRAVPEPSSLVLLALGGGALAGWRRWRKRITA
jgi:hypothetical protein